MVEDAGHLFPQIEAASKEREIVQQSDQTIWPNQAGLLTTSEGSQIRYYSSSSWVSALGDSEELYLISPSGLHARNDLETPQGLPSQSSSVKPSGATLYNYAPPGRINKLVCYFAEYHQFFYPVVDIPEITIALRDSASHGSLAADVSALVAAMCYGASSSLILSCEPDCSTAEPAVWKDLGHRFLFKSGYPLLPSMNNMRAAFLLAASSMAEWSMHPDPTPISVLIRTAQSLGLHRDPETFPCSLREADFRRRLWWSISALDLSYSLAHALPPMIHCSNSDVKTIKDENNLELKWLCFVTEVNHMFSRVLENIYGIRKPKKDLFDKLDQDINELSTYVAARSVKDTNVSQERFIHLARRMCCFKLTFILHQPYLRSASWPKESRGKALDSCINYIKEYTLTIIDPLLTQYRWILSHWNVFHACAIILQDLTQYPHSPESADIGSLIEATFSQFSRPADHNWKKLESLRLRAWNVNQWSANELSNTDIAAQDASLSDWDPLFASFLWDDTSPTTSGSIGL